VKTEEAVKGVAIVAGVAGAAYLIYDTVKHANEPATGARSLLSSAASSVVQTVATADVPAVRTGMPMLNGSTIIDPPNQIYNNLSAIRVMCTEILCENGSTLGGGIAAAFASCECFNGNLNNQCHNASLFNVHWRAGDPYPRVRIGNEIMPSFSTGKPTLVEAYRSCIMEFKNFLINRHPVDGREALEALKAGAADRFQIAIAKMNYSPGYTATVTNNVITGSHFIRERYQRLVTAGLLDP
jgi:hypothetical protein